jgi:serine/threonine-protein kinase
LQNGMVTRDHLVMAFTVWTATPGKPLAEWLAAQGALCPGHRPLLDALVDAHVKLHGGDPEKSLAALDLNSSTRESLAAAGGPVVEGTLAHVGSGLGSNGDADRTASYAVGTTNGHRFRVLRPHARGGLGAVYVALDTELNREVALKQILEHHADDPVSRQRFLVEAQITGGLEHPGIVPVYGLGAYGDGRPYYAMRLIKGDSLKEAIEEFHGGEPGRVSAGSRSPKTRGADANPLALRKLLRRFVDVCNAIEYAHSRGVLHRDIKPGNVIVGKHGETLVVDWGLAKVLRKDEGGRMRDEKEPDAAIPASSFILHPSSLPSETLPGQALGTPAYMSPEQARGDWAALGPRSDVYSLGATLYCLLTGRPPFEGEDVGSVLRAVQRSEFPAPRRLDPTIDTALEAICICAMATDPQARYGRCHELADDVERWLADEPVTAWREPAARRARRWARRNRTVVAAAAVALLAGVAGLAAVLGVQTKAKNALAVSNGSLRAALGREEKANADLEAANDRVRQRYELAVEAIKTTGRSQPGASRCRSPGSGPALIHATRTGDLRRRRRMATWVPCGVEAGIGTEAWRCKGTPWPSARRWRRNPPRTNPGRSALLRPRWTWASRCWTVAIRLPESRSSGGPWGSTRRWRKRSRTTSLIK